MRTKVGNRNSGRSASSVSQFRKASRERRTALFVESLERRELLAADYLYSLEARPGVPQTGFGFSQTANSQYQVVANFADYVSPLFPEQYPGSYQDRFYGEIQVHDAATGNLIRTIQNPLPYGYADLSTKYGFNNSWITPNAFGFSLDLHDNLLLVGSPGWEGRFAEQPGGGQLNLGGRAFLFDIETGDLLHTFHGFSGPESSLTNTGFGRSVAIDGSYIIIGAHGPSYDDPELQLHDVYVGEVNVFSTVTYDLHAILDTLDPQNQLLETLDFGATVSLSDGKLTVTQGELNRNPLNPTLIYDVATTNLLHTLPVNGSRAFIEGNVIAVADGNNTVIANAVTGAITQTLSAPLLDTDGNRIVSGTLGLNTSFELEVLDFPTGNDLHSVPSPPNFVEANWEYNHVPQVFGERLLVPGVQGTAAPKNVVFVYSLDGTGAGNSPPTDMALSSSAIPENSPNGTLVGTLSATDPDVPETFTYSLIDGANGRFALNGNQLIVANGSIINYEASPFLFVGVRVTDSAGNTYDEQLTISVTNVDEPITGLALLDHKVVEQSPNGTLVAAIDNPAPTPSDRFGNMAATTSRLLVTSIRSPQAYLLDALSFETVHPLQTSWQDLAPQTSVAISEDYAVIGNPGDKTQGSGAGAVDVFDVATGTRVQTLYAPNSNSKQFGTSVSIFGNRVAVSSHSGLVRVDVFQLSTGNFLYSVDSPLASSSLFGRSVALTNDHLVVGQVSGAGSVHVYSATNGAFLYTINNPTPAVDDFFGDKVIVRGNRILVGATNDDAVGANAGAVHLFEAVAGTLLHTFLPSAVPVGTNVAVNFGNSLEMNFVFTRIAIGSRGSTSVKLYDAITYAEFQELPGVHLGSETFGEHLAFSGTRLLVGDRASRGAFASGELQVFNAITGQLQSGLRVLPDDAGDTYTFTLLDDAGGRFALQGNQLVVANGAAIDRETATTHNVTVRVTDAAGSTHTQVLTIDVIDANEPPTNVTLSNSTVSETSTRWLHSPDAAAASFGDVISASGDTILVSELSGAEKTVYAIHAATGQQLQEFSPPVLNATAGQPDGDFGRTTAVAGNLAYIGANATKVGNLERAGAVYVFDIATGSALYTLNSPTPTADGFFGSALAVAGNVLAVSAHNESGGKIYLYNATNGQLLETIANPTPAPLEAFGQFLSMSGNTIVTSSRFENVGGVPTGVAYIYQFNQVTSVATLVHTLNDPTPVPGEVFGLAVAVAGNLVAVKDNAAVGAMQNVGSVHLYHRVTGQFLRTIDNPEPSAADQFGSSLLINGQLVIASSNSDLGGTNNGRAYVFQANTGELLATIENPSPNAGDEFASQLVVAGDRLIASARLDDTDGANRGLVYVVDLPIGQTVGTFSATDPEATDTITYFLSDSAGGRFAIDGNKLVIANSMLLNHETSTQHSVTVAIVDTGGNQISRTFPITVTAINEPPIDTQPNNSSFERGYVRNLHHPNASKGFGIGYSTAAEGNLVVTGTNNLTTGVGEVYVMNAATGQLVTKIASPAPENNEAFGENVAIANNRVVVSSRSKDAGAVPNAGRAYVFNATTGALLHILGIAPPSANMQFGSDVAADGDLIAIASLNHVFLFNAVTGNLLTTNQVTGTILSLDVDNDTIVVGANSEVRVYQYNPTTQSTTLVRSIANPALTSDDRFGSPVRVDGNTIAVGAWLSGQSATGAGRAYVFDRNSGALLHTLSKPSPVADDQFGHQLALDNNLLAVAVQGDDTGATDSGAVYLYDIVSGNLMSIFHNPSPNALDFFSRVSIANGRLIVGTPRDTTDGPNKGMVYVFELDGGKTLATLTTSDPDPGETVSYELLDDFGGVLKLQGNSIVVADGFMLDQPEYPIPIRATDASGLSTTEQLTVQIVDGPQPPLGISFVGNAVAENSGNSTVVSTLSVQDVNVGDTFTFSLTDNAGGRFAILGNTIVVNNGANLDFEASPTHTVIVTVTDSSGLSTYESLVINVADIVEPFDFGDLPDSFGTTLAANGARHLINNGLRLGASVTGDTNGQPGPGANLDTGDDGVVMPLFLVPGMGAAFVVNASQAGRLNAFLDIDGDGQFSASEQLTPAAGLLLASGFNSVPIAIPANVIAGDRALRFRLSSAGGLSAVGPAMDGEVEDYFINAIIPVPFSSQVVIDPEFPGTSMLLVNGSAGNDTILVNAGPSGARATINGIPGSLTTVASRVVILGLGGDDDLRINGSALRGYIDGGDGNDTIRGSNINDVLLGSAGDDLIFGRSGDDTIFGGSGNDILIGNGGVDTIFGQSGNDYLTGHGILVGGSGIDDLSGVSSRNVLIGGVGADVLRAGNSSQGDLFVTGPTIHDENVSALAAIRAEWAVNATTAQRIAHIDGTLRDGLNSTYLLNSSTVGFETNADIVLNLGSINLEHTDWVIRSTLDRRQRAVGYVTIIGTGSANIAGDGEGEPPLTPPAPINFIPLLADVNEDSNVTPIDALLIINQLNRSAASGPLDDSDSAANQYALDVNGDELVTPLDALLVINQLNVKHPIPHPPTDADESEGNGEGEGEGSNMPWAVDAIMEDWPNNFKRKIRPSSATTVTLSPPR